MIFASKTTIKNEKAPCILICKDLPYTILNGKQNSILYAWNGHRNKDMYLYLLYCHKDILKVITRNKLKWFPTMGERQMRMKQDLLCIFFILLYLKQYGLFKRKYKYLNSLLISHASSSSSSLSPFNANFIKLSPLSHLPFTLQHIWICLIASPPVKNYSCWSH